MKRTQHNQSVIGAFASGSCADVTRSAAQPACDHALLRIAQVVHSISPEWGGLAVSVPALCEGLATLGHDVQLYVTRDRSSDAGAQLPFMVHRHVVHPFGSKFGIAPSLYRALREAAGTSHVVHSHALWLWTNLAAYLAARRTDTRLVLSPRGTLEPVALARSSWRKRVAWSLGQRAAAHAAHCIHVTAESEAASVRRAGLASPISIIPNGVRVPTTQTRRGGRYRTLLYLGRIHPIKAIDVLVQAWTRVAPQFSDWELVIAGPGEPRFVDEMKALALGQKTPRIRFDGPAYGSARDECLAQADLFVTPTRTENFGLTIAEALAVGRPVICTKGAPWAGVESRRCGFWIDFGVEALAACLHTALRLTPDDLDAMGARGRAWMQADFSWEAQAEKMVETYRWLLSGGSRPAFVFLD